MDVPIDVCFDELSISDATLVVVLVGSGVRVEMFSATGVSPMAALDAAAGYAASELARRGPSVSAAAIIERGRRVWADRERSPDESGVFVLGGRPARRRVDRLEIVEGA